MQEVKQQTVYDNNPELYQNINKENIPIANLIFFFIYNLYWYSDIISAVIVFATWILSLKHWFWI